MRMIVLSMAALALAACNKNEPAANTAANDMAASNVAMANDSMTATPAAFINETSWEYVDPDNKKAVQESIDASGNYVTWAGSEHVDHGTAVMKNGKACFTSAMNNKGEMCWTDPKWEIGQSGESTNDKGEKLALKRVAYIVAPPIPGK